MANIKSQIKRNRQTLKAQARNKGARSEVRTRVKAAEAAIANGADDAEALVKIAIVRIDRAANKHIMHRNAAARAKSRLMHKLNAAS